MPIPTDSFIPHDDPKIQIYRNYIEVILKIQPAIDLQPLLRKIYNQELVDCLADGEHYRGELDSAWSSIMINSDVDRKRVLDALDQDSDHIAVLLKLVLQSSVHRHAARLLAKGPAEEFMVLLMKTIDRRPHEWGANTTVGDSARRLLVKLSIVCGILPKELRIEGVTCSSPFPSPTGGGSFADVYCGKYEGKQVALKYLRPPTRDRNHLRLQRVFNREAVTWSKLEHPHILKFLGIDTDAVPGRNCMVSWWMANGTVMEYMSKLPLEPDINKFLHETALGVKYLHEQQIVHGDLSGRNILIDDERHVRIADFGLSTFANWTHSGMNAISTTYSGNPRWMAPELLQPDSFKRTYASDVYAFSCVCVELYSKKQPFHETTNGYLIPEMVLNGQRPERPSDQSGNPMPLEMWNLVQSGWRPVPLDRPTMSTIAETISNIRSRT